jgi:hypothetical protein
LPPLAGLQSYGDAQTASPAQDAVTTARRRSGVFVAAGLDGAREPSINHACKNRRQ